MRGEALASIRRASKDRGNKPADAMGAMCGPTGAIPGLLPGLIILSLIQERDMSPMFANSLRLVLNGRLFRDPKYD